MIGRFILIEELPLLRNAVFFKGFKAFQVSHRIGLWSRLEAVVMERLEIHPSCGKLVTIQRKGAV